MSIPQDVTLLRENIARLNKFMNGADTEGVVLSDGRTITSLAGLIGSTAGPTPPPVTWPGRHWYDTSSPFNPVLRIRDAADLGWIILEINDLASNNHDTQLSFAASPPDQKTWIRVHGREGLSDGGGGEFVRVPSQPLHGGYIYRPSDATYWEYFPKNGINARTLGALGTDDDNPGLQAALAMADILPFKTVYLPASNASYVFTALSVPTGVTLEGRGGKMKFKDGVAVDPTASYYPLQSLSNTDGAKFINLEIDGNGVNNPFSDVCDVITAFGYGVEVKGCRVKDAPDCCLTVAAAGGGLVDDFEGIGARDAIIYVNESNEDNPDRRSLRMSNLYLSNAVVTGLAIKRSAEVITVSNFAIENCGTGVSVEYFDASAGGGGAPDDLSFTNGQMHNIGYMHRGLNIAERGFSIIYSTGVSISNVTGSNISGIGAYFSGCVQCSMSNTNLTGYTTDPMPSVDGNVGLMLDEREGRDCQDVKITTSSFMAFGDEGGWFKNATRCKSSLSTYQGGSYGFAISAPCSRLTVVHNDFETTSANSAVPDLAIFAGVSASFIENNHHMNASEIASFGIRTHPTHASPLNLIDPLRAGEKFETVVGGRKLWIARTGSSDSWVLLAS